MAPLPVEAVENLLQNGLVRYMDAMLIGKLLVTGVLLAFGLYVSFRARKDPQQLYWTNMINLWVGRNSWGLFVMLFNLWFLTYFIGFLSPIAVRLEQLLAAAIPQTVAKVARLSA